MAKTVLIADDNDTVRTIIKMTLQFKGYNLLEANDGEPALQLLQDGSSVDLLISDIAMPKMSGLDLLKRVRADERFSNLPILICSAEADISEADLVNRGASAFLRKPVHPMELLETVQRLIG